MLPENKINAGNSSTAVDDEIVESIQVDDDEIVEVEDSTGDVNVAAKLPPRGVYAFKFKAGKKEDSIYKSATKTTPHRAFVGVNGLTGAIQDEEYEGIVVFHNHINSLQRSGKPTSDLHHFLNVVGNPAPNRTTVAQLESHVRETLDQEPLGYAEIDWKAQYKSGKQTKDGKDEYLEIKTTMEAFPKHYINEDGETVAGPKEGGKWDGTYLQIVPHPITGEDIEARLYFRKFLTQSEANKMKERMRSS